MTAIRENIDNILTSTGNVIAFLFPQIYDFTAGLILSVFNIFLGFILSIYLLADNERLLRQFENWSWLICPKKSAQSYLKYKKSPPRHFQNLF